MTTIARSRGYISCGLQPPLALTDMARNKTHEFSV